MGEPTLTAILVHGFLDSGEIWSPLLESLGNAAAGWSAPDLPGMGKLWRDKGPFTLNRYAEFVEATVDEAKGPVVLIGHSMGSQIVELVALRRPKNVRGLVLLSPVPLGGVHAPAEITNKLASTGGDVDAQREVRRGFMAQPVDAAVLESLTALGRNIRREVTKAVVTAFNEGVAEGMVPSRFDGAVLVAAGDADPFVTTQMSTDVAARFRNCPRVSLPNCGHWPQAEHPELVAQLISRFVTELSGKQNSGKGAEGWMHAFDDRSESTFGDAFAPDVVFEATVLTRRVEGRERVRTILGVASRLYEALEFTRRAKEADRTYLEWEARLHGGERVNGITILTADPSGSIKAIAIHHRPLPGVLRFSRELRRDLAGRIETDLFYEG